MTLFYVCFLLPASAQSQIRFDQTGAWIKYLNTDLNAQHRQASARLHRPNQFFKFPSSYILDSDVVMKRMSACVVYCYWLAAQGWCGKG